VKTPPPEGRPASDETSSEARSAERPASTPSSTQAAVAQPIDFDGILTRVARVPIGADNYANLTAKAGFLLYRVTGASYYGRQPDRQPQLKIYSLTDRKEATLADDVRAYALSRDGSKVLAAQGQSYNLYDATLAGDRSKKSVSTSGLAVDRVPAEEWTQIFNEVWRRYRDWFYVSNMHGYDWAALREQYKPLLQYVAHRSDLNYVIAEMISELTVQHAYIEGGDLQLEIPRPRVGLPGARFELDKEAGRFRIGMIFEGENEEDIYRSPLTEIGVDAHVGDYVLAIDGQDLKGDDDPYRLLRNKADGQVQLTLNSRPTIEGARVVSYRPISDESNLMYLSWVAKNRQRVSDATGGRVGYIHIPDMGAAGIREFIKWFYPQIRKEGLVVDVRANGGGNVSRMLIERLRRRLLGLGYSRTDDEATTYPDGVFLGPMVGLLDSNSASDGDVFPAMFREAGLGPLVGKRSWGGVVGITNRGGLIDGGTVFVPEFGMASKNGDWIIEGYGVDPDIEVDNDPKSEIEGRDPQLERAIAEVLSRLKQPVRLPPRPQPPVKTVKPAE
jgi:tricorn protease